MPRVRKPDGPTLKSRSQWNSEPNDEETNESSFFTELQLRQQLPVVNCNYDDIVDHPEVWSIPEEPIIYRFNIPQSYQELLEPFLLSRI